MNVLERKIADCAYSVLGFASPCWESSGALGCSGSPNGAYKREGRRCGGGAFEENKCPECKKPVPIYKDGCPYGQQKFT